MTTEIDTTGYERSETAKRFDGALRVAMDGLSTEQLAQIIESFEEVSETVTGAHSYGGSSDHDVIEVHYSPTAKPPTPGQVTDVCGVAGFFPSHIDFDNRLIVYAKDYDGGEWLKEFGAEYGGGGDV